VVLRIVLGALYVAMGLGQTASASAMPGILDAYQVVDGPGLPWLAAALIVAEAGCGLWLLTRPRSRSLTPVWLFTGVAVVWAALGAQAYVRGLPIDNCGCFGRYLAQPLSGFVLAQDALLLVYAALLVRATRRARDADADADAADDIAEKDIAEKREWSQ
jgi:hypothetical protein